MEIKPVKTEADYRAAMEEVERLFDSMPGTPKGTDWRCWLPSSKPSKKNTTLFHCRTRLKLFSTTLRAEDSPAGILSNSSAGVRVFPRS